MPEDQDDNSNNFYYEWDYGEDTWGLGLFGRNAICNDEKKGIGA